MDVKAGDTSIGTGNYSVSGNTLTIKKEYLAEKPVGGLALSIEFNRGEPSALAITIADTTPVSATINPDAGTFERNPALGADVETTIAWNSARAVTDVKAGDISIGKTNYSVSGNKLAIRKEYLRKALRRPGFDHRV
jgi:hypothetical protein